ncbi:hypothetical protein Dda_6089 [Drechslerella dactyloides]|uniref:Uncharacterized protein n=1 Tax=Drechslerella dactyloides TaxID=74499 RepID=A0AAD6IVI1_DREDA|nr:hypothetical protein Dda_6089 [Drechslerella dactyloides]
MDPLDVTVIVPSTALPWWVTSPIAKWRFSINIADIAATEPQDLAILDWKILFEIALRHPSSLWRLCPPIILPTISSASTSKLTAPSNGVPTAKNTGTSLTTNSVLGDTGRSKKSKFTDSQIQIPILARIHRVDFVASRVIFRLDTSTIAALLSQHTAHVSQIQRTGQIDARRADRVARSFANRVNALQVTLNAAVLTATDGVCARGDFPSYAKRQRANQYVVRMLDVVLKESGLRKVIYQAFFDMDSQSCSPERPSASPSQTDGESASSFTSAGSGRRDVDSGSMSPCELPGPYCELQPTICRDTPDVPAAPAAAMGTSQPKRKREQLESSTSALPADKKRRCANIIENEHGGKGRRPSNIPPPPASPSSSPLSQPPPSSDDTIMASSTSPVQLDPPRSLVNTIMDLISSGTMLPGSSQVQAVTSPHKSPQPAWPPLNTEVGPPVDVPFRELATRLDADFAAIRKSPASPVVSGQTPRLAVETSPARNEPGILPAPRIFTDGKSPRAYPPAPAPKQQPKQQMRPGPGIGDLKYDEIKIFEMDSSFAPVTRKQAALRKTTPASPGESGVKVRVSLKPEASPLPPTSHPTPLSGVAGTPSPSPTNRSTQMFTQTFSPTVSQTVIQTPSHTVPQAVPQAVPQTVFQTALQTTLQTAPQADSQAIPQEVSQKVLQTAPQPVPQTVPQTATQKVARSDTLSTTPTMPAIKTKSSGKKRPAEPLSAPAPKRPKPTKKPVLRSKKQSTAAANPSKTLTASRTPARSTLTILSDEIKSTPSWSKRYNARRPKSPTSDYSDTEDENLDSDTPDIELLTDPLDKKEARQRKLDRRKRKTLRREQEARAAAAAVDVDADVDNYDNFCVPPIPGRLCNCGKPHCTWYDCDFPGLAAVEAKEQILL